MFKTIGIIIPTVVIGGLFFEHIRFVVTHYHRNKGIKQYWIQEGELEEIENDFKIVLKWKQKLFHSFSVAGRYVNPFLEWEDRNTTDIFAMIRYQITRNNRNGLPCPNLETNLPLVEPNFALLNEFTLKSHLRQSVEQANKLRLLASMDVDSAIGFEDITVSSIAKPEEGIESSIKDKDLSAVKISKRDSAMDLEMADFNQMTVTWIGQSTCFIQMDGYNILTDPIFCSRTTGEWFGPKRLRPPPCSLSQLPPIDIVLISHNHYDHLDTNVLYQLGDSCTWYVPMGLASWIKSFGIKKVIELDWWQEYKHDDKLLIASCPIQHWSGRHFFDVNSSLWCSFICKTSTQSFFHCGDTGYCSVFKEIGQKYGPVTLAALPIGSYEPRYFMCHQHMDPDEACKVHMDIQAKYSIGVHWGTFMMSDEHYMDPPKDFKLASEKYGLGKQVFTAHLGETILLDI
ncbi:hypothetical protein HDV06_004552 [Boothiomyces sp. JEL0866]|nr:hypothetical protein HDV06_004552 [Boothiomyces sp. JEL0866]